MTIEERVRADNPFFVMSEGTASFTVSPDEFPEWYEELIAERVAWATEAEAQQTLEQQRAALRKQFRTGMTRLNNNLTALRGTGSLTTAQLRTMLGDVTQGVLWLGDVLRDSGVFRPEDDV